MPTRATTTLAVLIQAGCCSALTLLAPRMPGAASASAAAVALPAPLAARIASPLCARAGAVRMDGSIYDEFLATDVATGERKIIGFAEKEKLYLDCLDAYYNDEKPVLSDEEYKQLKTDLDFEGSKLTAFSQDEIKFLIANKRCAGTIRARRLGFISAAPAPPAAPHPCSHPLPHTPPPLTCRVSCSCIAGTARASRC
jgi:hypothetical protein